MFPRLDLDEIHTERVKSSLDSMSKRISKIIWVDLWKLDFDQASLKFQQLFVQ